MGDLENQLYGQLRRSVRDNAHNAGASSVDIIIGSRGRYLLALLSQHGRTWTLPPARDHSI
jgi:hypothetical protein